MGWLYAPGSAGSSLVSAWPQTAAPCATSSGTASPHPSSWPGWRRRSWIALLSPTISDPSTAGHGVAEWISSLRATRVSHSASPASGSESATNATSGPKCDASSTSAARRSPSSRTSPGTFALGSPRCLPTLPSSGSMRSGACSARPRSARRTSASDCSRWPTATAKDSASSGAAAYSTESGRHSGTTLTDAARMWATPCAHDGRRPGADTHSTQGANLSRDVAMWATPTSRNWKDGACRDANVPTNALLGRQVLRTPMAGDLGSSAAVLSPPFVEALMGMPPSWTVPTASALSATEWSRWWRRMRSELLQLECRGVAA